MRKNDNSIASIIFDTLSSAAVILPQLLPRPFETKYSWANRLRHLDPDSYRRTINRLKSQGYLQAIKKNGRLFVKLTKAGQLEGLAQKVSLNRSNKWDGKWRLVIFDIPEDSKKKRNLFRALLKKNNFVKLQASVYISPYSFSREALDYLKESKLISFIRILKVEDMDDDSDLKKSFDLR